MLLVCVERGSSCWTLLCLLFREDALLASEYPIAGQRTERPTPGTRSPPPRPWLRGERSTGGLCLVPVPGVAWLADGGFVHSFRIAGMLGTLNDGPVSELLRLCDKTLVGELRVGQTIQ